MDNKEIYRQLCEAEGVRIPLFQQYWWMETVCCGKEWDVLLARSDDGTIEGALPYLYGRRLGVRYILQPQLTQFNGPWYNHSQGCDPTAFENRVGRQLAAQIKALHPAIYIQHFAPETTNWLPFLWEGYRQTTRYTYRLDPIPTPQELPALATRDRRKGIEAVRTAYSVDKAVSPSELASLHRAYWHRRAGHDLLQEEFILRVATTSLERHQALIYGLRDSDQRLMAVRMAVYDSHCAHSLLSALHPDAMRNCMTYLTWQVIGDLHGATRIFDFEGSIDPGIERFYRSFGARQTPYFEVTRFRPRMLKYLLHL